MPARSASSVTPTPRTTQQPAVRICGRPEISGHGCARRYRYDYDPSASPARLTDPSASPARLTDPSAPSGRLTPVRLGPGVTGRSRADRVCHEVGRRLVG